MNINIEITENELYAILKGLNCMQGTTETQLDTMQIFQLQAKLQGYTILRR